MESQEHRGLRAARRPQIMIGKLLRAVVPTKNTRELRRMGRLVRRINEFEEETAALTFRPLQAMSDHAQTQHP